MIRLKSLLHESKQVGDIYHFTPLSNVAAMLKTQYMIPNDERQISTTRWADMSTSGFQDMKSKPVARFMFDGNKLSTKYQIRPFSYNPSGASGNDDEYENLGEEQIIVDGRNFYFMPYLKRIDIFVQRGNPDLTKSISILDKMNIPYSVYQGTPKSNIPFTQPKEGDPTQLKYNPVAKEILVTTKEIQYPYPNFKTYKFNNNPQTYPLPEDRKIKSPIAEKRYSQRPYEIFNTNWDLTPMFPNHYVRFANNGTIYSLTNDFTEPKYNDTQNAYWPGSDYRNPITKLILNSIEFKTWRDLGLEEKINTEISKIVQYFPGVKYNIDAGLQLIPKQLVDKYLIPYESKPSYVQKWVTPKTPAKPKYDWTGIDTPGDPNM